MSDMKIMKEDYFCTWCEQGRAAKNYREKEEKGEPTFLGDQGYAATGSRDGINEETVFGEHGWIHYYPETRSDMYFLIDDGWDVDYNTVTPKDFPKFGSHEVNAQRFPSFKGTPEEKLTQFVERVKAAGWKGLGIWVVAQAYGEDFEKPVRETKDYWRAMLERSKKAGVSYWKVDWGKCAYTAENRKIITDLAHEIYPELIVEHAICMFLINDKDSDYGRFRNDEAYDRGMAFASYSDVLRTYDVSQLAISSTLDRVSCVLPGAHALINCESECYMGAGLGFALGIMGGPDTVPCGTHALAATRWHRIAPPFVGGETCQSEEILTDYFDFTEGSTWATFLVGRRIHQSAPAVIARNTPLPEVKAKGEKPFVVASLNPTGAYSVAALERLLGTEQILKAEVRCLTETNPTDIGIFGEFENLTFCFSKVPAAVKMRNLLSDEMVDVTGKITLEKELKVSGDVLRLFESGKDRIQSAIHMMVSFE